MTADRIEAVEVWPLEVPLASPFEIALGTQHHCRNVIVEVRTAGGTRGYGEAAPTPHITGETRETVLAAGDAVTDSLVGRPVTDYRGIARFLRETLSAQSAARAGIETAVFDALCRSMDRSLAEFVGGRNAEVRTDDTISLEDPATAREYAADAAAAGFDELKVKVGDALDRDLQRVLAVDEGAPGAAIKADANQGYTVKGAVAFVDRLAERGVDLQLLEQPVRHDDLAGMARVRSAVDVPVAADESVFTRTDALRVVENEAADVLNVKLAKSGIVDALDVLGIARAANLEAMIGCMIETPVGIAAGAHLVAGTGDFSYVDLDGHFDLDDDRFETGYAPSLAVAGPGIGVEPSIVGP